MKSLKDIQKSIQEFTIKPAPEMRSRVLDEALTLQRKQPRPVNAGLNIGRIIMRSTQFSASAAILILAVLVTYNLFGPGTSAAFAHAMEQFAAAETARFELTIEFGEQEPQMSSFLYDANGYIRQNMANGTVNFVDYNTGKVLSMVPDANTVFIRNVNHPDFHTALHDIFTNLQGLIRQAIQIGYGDVEALGTKMFDGRTAYGWRIETSPELSELFEQRQGTLTVWAETQTDIPLMFIWHNSIIDITVTVSNIQLDVVFAPDELSITVPEGYRIQDETLPAAEPTPEPVNAPAREAYPQVFMGAGDMNIEELIKDLDETDRTLIKFFHSWTVLTNGKFPSSLTTDSIKDISPDAKISFTQKEWGFSFSFHSDLPEILGDDWKAGIDPNDYTAEEKEQLKEQRGRYYEDLQAALNQALEGIKPLIQDAFKGFEFINTLTPRSDWHYTGEDVEPGDAETAIFWYLPQGSTVYHVIYGDLTIGDIEPKDLHLLQPPSPEEADRQTNEALETAIQLGADIPADKRATVLRMLTLKEKDLIKGLATYLEFSGGSFPPTLNASREFMSHLNELSNLAYETQKIDKKQFEAKVLDIGFGTFFYDELTRKKKDPAYYGGSLTVNDADKVLVRWKLSKDRYRVIFGSLAAKTVSTEELAELENQTTTES